MSIRQVSSRSEVRRCKLLNFQDRTYLCSFMTFMAQSMRTKIVVYKNFMARGSRALGGDVCLWK